MPTEYDWRVGVLGGQPLFAVHYLMVEEALADRQSRPRRQAAAGRHQDLHAEEAPPLVVETAVNAARCIGDGLYGVDLKETKDGVFVIEVNDNPNLDHGWEDSGEKDEVWTRLTQWFLDRLDRPGR